MSCAKQTGSCNKTPGSDNKKPDGDDKKPDDCVSSSALPVLFKKIISTPLAPRPVAPYNQAIVVDRTVYVSGVLGLDKDTNKMVPGGVQTEAKQALQNLGHILEAAGSSYAGVVKCTVLLNNMSDFGAVNEVYKEYFNKDFPARTAFQVGMLPLNAQIEIDVIAITGKIEKSSL